MAHWRSAAAGHGRFRLPVVHNGRVDLPLPAALPFSPARVGVPAVSDRAGAFVRSIEHWGPAPRTLTRTGLFDYIHYADAAAVDCAFQGGSLAVLSDPRDPPDGRPYRPEPAQAARTA